ncbi:MAG TPA: LysR family transcriptional regulator [Caulobacteraceae bacterium]|nr:LysR family transcriptional regulator [Caulobacteraceae bacterium]
MAEPGAPSLDQLQVFRVVVDAGGFAAAARRLGRATSAVSYQIDTLEAQLGVSLFDRVTTRRPVLTAAGQVVLAEACAVTRSVDVLRAKVRGLLAGLEAEVSLVVDVMLPTWRLVDAARAFQEAFPTVSLRLHVESLGAVGQLVHDRIATLGVSGPLHATPQAFEMIAVGGVDIVPVAAPEHALAEMSPIPSGEARDHIQLVLSDRSPLTQGQDFGVLSLKTWRLADLSAKHALLLAGVGWGGMPRAMVDADLQAGRLTILGIPEWGSVTYPFHVIHRIDAPPGPSGRWLIDRFRGQAA